MRPCTVYTSLRKRPDFIGVHEGGRRRGDAVLQVRAVRSGVAAGDGGPPMRLGIQVSARYGDAVERNRFKRLVRAAIVELGPELTPGWDVLVLPRAAKAAKMADVRESLRGLLRWVGVIIEPPDRERG